jgi:predicted branched-subunit amino acid permease
MHGGQAMNRVDFLEGLRGGALVGAATLPFGALFGAVAHGHGMSLGELTLMSGIVYAGASQLVGLDLFGHDVAAWLIVLSILAVNFRHILYSAAIARYIGHFTGIQKFFTFFLLVDPQFAETVRRGEAGKHVSFEWYLGLAMAIYVPWVLSSLVGGMLGSLIGDPRSIGLDVLLPVYFLGIVVGFRRRDNFLSVVATSAVAAVVAYRYVGSPWHVSIGALAGVAVAALLPPVKTDPKPDLAVENHEA